MLVDGGAGLNLISPAVIEKLQIPDEDLEDTGTLQGSIQEEVNLRERSRCPLFLGAI